MSAWVALAFVNIDTFSLHPLGSSATSWDRVAVASVAYHSSTVQHVVRYTVSGLEWVLDVVDHDHSSNAASDSVNTAVEVE